MGSGLRCLNTEKISAPHVHMSDGCMDVIALPAQAREGGMGGGTREGGAGGGGGALYVGWVMERRGGCAGLGLEVAQPPGPVSSL